jgi:hypothetical protein
LCFLSPIGNLYQINSFINVEQVCPTTLLSTWRRGSEPSERLVGGATLHLKSVGIKCSADGLYFTPTVATRLLIDSVSIGLEPESDFSAFLSSRSNKGVSPNPNTSPACFVIRSYFSELVEETFPGENHINFQKLLTFDFLSFRI